MVTTAAVVITLAVIPLITAAAPVVVPAVDAADAIPPTAAAAEPSIAIAATEATTAEVNAFPGPVCEMVFSTIAATSCLSILRPRERRCLAVCSDN